MPFHAYMLLCSDGSYYTGHTDDLGKRLYEHNNKDKCHYTSTRRPVKLVWSQQFPTREEAKAAEIQIKGWTRRKKQALINGDFEALKSAAKKTNWSRSKSTEVPE